MICYELPLSRYPDTYNGQPLGTAALAAQVRHYSLYLYGVYMSPELTQRLRDAYAASGKKLDMGKSCVRFRNLDGIDLDAAGERHRRRQPRRPDRDVRDIGKGEREAADVSAQTAGLVCAHHHLYSTLARGMPAPPVVPTTFGEILEQVWWRLDVALDLDILRASARLGAVEASARRHDGDRRPPREPQRDRGLPRRDRRRLRRGRSPRRVRVWRHRSARPRRGPSRSRRERALPPRGRPGDGRRPRRVHVHRRHAGGGGGARRRPRRRRAHPRRRRSGGRWRRRAPRRPRHRRLAARPLRAPRPGAAGHHRPQPAQQHEQRRRLRPPRPPAQPRRARHRRDRGRHVGGVPPRLRRPPRRRRTGHARTRRGRG